MRKMGIVVVTLQLSMPSHSAAVVEESADDSRRNGAARDGDNDQNGQVFHAWSSFTSRGLSSSQTPQVTELLLDEEGTETWVYSYTITKTVKTPDGLIAQDGPVAPWLHSGLLRRIPPLSPHSVSI